MREALYLPLAEIANRWNEALGISMRYPADHDAFIARCATAGQAKPTPLLLRYAEGDYNCLHQDSTASMSFRCRWRSCCRGPVRTFTGGEFVLTEQRPRMQSRAEVVPLKQGEG